MPYPANLCAICCTLPARGDTFLGKRVVGTRPEQNRLHRVRCINDTRYAVRVQTKCFIRWKSDSPAAAWYFFFLLHTKIHNMNFLCKRSRIFRPAGGEIHFRVRDRVNSINEPLAIMPGVPSRCANPARPVWPPRFASCTACVRGPRYETTPVLCGPAGPGRYESPAGCRV